MSLQKLLTNFYKYKRKLNLFSHTTFQEHWCIATSVTKSKETKNLRILFFGTDRFSLPSLEHLHKNNSCYNNVPNLGVVTSFKSPANCVRTYAELQKLPLYRWPIEPDACRNYDLGVVVSFGHLIPSAIIKAFPLGMINVHASLLPRWRGAAPIIYAIMRGDVKTGVSIMKIEPKHFDIGDILAQLEVPIGENVFMPELHARLAEEGAGLLVDVINDFHQRFQNAKVQNNEEVTYAPKITSTATEVVWQDMNAQEIYNLHRALYSFKHLVTTFEGKIMQLIDIKLVALDPSGETALKTAQAGAFVYVRSKKCLLVRCANNSFIEVYQLRVESKKVMSAADFNNGFLKKLKLGEQLFLSNKSAV